MVTLAGIRIDNDMVDEAIETSNALVEARRSASTSPRYESDLANAYLEAARIQRRAGQLERALQTAQEGERLFRKLAENEPLRHGPDFCRGLRMVADIQNDAGYTRRALPSLQKCIQSATPIWEVEPTRYLLEQANDLLSLSRRLRSVPRVYDAREAAEKAVALFREAVKLNPERQLEQLGWALNHLSFCEMDCAYSERSIAAMTESLCCMRTHVGRFPTRSPLPVIVVLRTATWLHASIKQPKKALFVAELAVRMARKLCTMTPSLRNKEELARTLEDLFLRRRGAGDLAGALASIQDAVAAWRSVAALSHTHLLNLAGSLEDLSSIEEKRDKTAALQARQEAHRVYGEASQYASVAAEPKMAANLIGIADLVADPRQSLDALNDAIRLFEYHAPQSYLALRRLPDSLEQKAKALKKYQIVQGQIVILRRAVRSRELLMDEQVDGALGSLVRVLEELASAFREIGQQKNASSAIEQARLLVDAYADWFEETQIRRIAAFDRSDLPLRQLVTRRIWGPCQSAWRALRVYGATRVARALS
jgi:tetratricopeptide (TPR) repeat protein